MKIAYCLIVCFLSAVLYAADQDASVPAAESETPKPNVIATSNKIVDVGTEKPKITEVPGGVYFEWPSYNNIGSIEVDKSLVGAAQIMFDVPLASIDKKPEPVTNPQLIVTLADYWMVRDKPERAIKLYRAGLKEQPDSLLFQNNLAMLLSAKEGKHAEALEFIEKALAKQKDNVTLLDSKGLILINNNQASEAVPVLQRAVELSCQLPVYCMHLAAALDLDGRSGGAKRFFQQAKAQLDTMAPNMASDNKAMYNRLNMKYPSTGSEAPAP